MRVFSAAVVAAGLLLPFSLSAATIRPHRHTSTHALVRRDSGLRTRHTEHASAEHSGYSSMSSERASEIQSALIQRGYLSGEPSGSWDSASYAAMQKLQSDNGWQTKLVPDSRALIKLGLGPNSNPDPSAAALASPAMSASN